VRDLKTNIVWKHLEKSQKKIIIEQGGSRSGKTYNILIWIIFGYSLRNKNKIISICRKTFPALRTSAMRDFFEILKTHELYKEEDHNKTSSEYKINGNLIEFISLDSPQKVRGRKRDLLFINEANELFWEDWNQLIFRTIGRVILDYNPSDDFHWIYDKVKVREDADFFRTTYKDNKFLEESIVKEIERLQFTDENYWRIYGLGEVGQSKATIFQFREIDTIPENAKFVSLGMDFGYTNDPTCISKIYLHDTNLYCEELLYRTGMTNRDIHNELLNLEIGRRDEIFADSAEPKTIDELYRYGWNIKPSTKGRDSINIGIDMLKRYTIHVKKNSQNAIKEFRNYKWKEDKNGNILNQPEDKWNHFIDSLRYGIYNKLAKPNYGKYAIR
jgi:phage terminase large subunit